jgi:peptidoglycan/LPS O-acetylase OafA/YrhL
MAISPSLRHWWINIPLAILVSSAFAAFSWRFVEKRTLKFRPMLYRLQGRTLVLFEAGFRCRLANTPNENNT